MSLFLDVAFLYCIYIAAVVLIVWRYGLKDRGPLTVVAIIFPFMLITSVAVGTFRMFSMKQHRIRPCPEGLHEAEEALADSRQRLFGGKRADVYFASAWARVYGQTLEEEARSVNKLARRFLAFA